MKITEAIGRFLRAKVNDNNRDLIDRWSPAMETQLNVDETKGTPISEGKHVWIYEDERDSFEFRNIRIPFNAKSDPINNDGEIDFPVGEVAEGIGSTGWDYKDCVSRWVGFDFDSIVGHGDGLSHEQLAEIKEKVRNLDYAEVRNSTGGKGIHVYVHLNSIPTSNHTEHAKVGKIILEKMSGDVDFDFLIRIDGKKLVDVCGGNMWLWHRKMTLQNEGLKLLKASTQSVTLNDLPSDWRERIRSDPRIEKSAPASQPAGDPLIEAAKGYINRVFGVGLDDGRRRTAFRLAGHLSAFVDANGKKLFAEDQTIGLVRWWNDQNDPPLDDDTVLCHAEGGIHRGTPPDPKPESLLYDLDQDFAAIRDEMDHTESSPATDTHKSFPVHCLPSPIAEYVATAVESITCDPSYIVMPLLSALSRTITNKRVIKVKKDWCEPAIVWGVIVGLSGDGKSPAMREVGRFLRDRQAELLQKNEESIKHYEEAMKEHKVRHSKWENEAKKTELNAPLQPLPKEPEEPTCERLYVSDTTTEALVFVLSRQRAGLLLWRPELNGWIGSFGEFKKGKGGNDQAHWLQFFDGDESYTLRKSDNAKGNYVRRASVNIFGGIQPGILAKLDDSHLKSGLVARLLFAWPNDDPVGWSDAVVNPLVVQKMEAVFDRLFKLETPEEPVAVPLTPDARDLFKQYVLRNKAEIKELAGDLRAAWVKLKSYVARFALIFGMVNDEQEISVESVRAAIHVADWFGEEARRVYTLFGRATGQADDFELLAWIVKNGGKMTVGKLQSRSRTWRDPGKAQAALERLVQAQVLRRQGSTYTLAV